MLSSPSFWSCSLFLLLQHVRSPSVSCLDVDTSPPTTESSPASLTLSTPARSHRRSASCGTNPTGNVQGSGPDMRILRIRMDLHDGNLYRSILVPNPNRAAEPQETLQAVFDLFMFCFFQVTSNDKTPGVISSALEKHNQDPKQASRYELIQLLPEGKGKNQIRDLFTNVFIILHIL